MDTLTQSAHIAESETTPPLFIVLNAGSGDKNAETVASTLAEIFYAAKQSYELFLCRHPGDIAEMTKQAVQLASDRHGVVVAAGGDGTIRYIAQAVLAAGLPFGILPLGTFNYFARDHGVSQALEQAVQALMTGMREGNERQVQVGLLNDEVFLVNASLGLYPQLLADREVFKQQHGRSRLVAKWAALVTILKRDIKMLLRIAHSGGEHKTGEDVMPASTIFVGNNAIQLHDVGLASESQCVKNGQLAIIALPPMTVFKRFAVAFRGMLGLLRKAPDVTHFACRQLVVEPLRLRKPYVKVAMDGEVSHMRPPLIFRVSPNCLRLIVPKPGIKESGIEQSGIEQSGAEQ